MRENNGGYMKKAKVIIGIVVVLLTPMSINTRQKIAIITSSMKTLHRAMKLRHGGFSFGRGNGAAAENPK